MLSELVAMQWFRNHVLRHEYSLFCARIKLMSNKEIRPLHEHDNELVVAPAKPDLRPPPMYKVVLMNDDFTPMEFVVEVLLGFFALMQEQAVQVMLEVHNKGKAVAGIYTAEIAETKAAQVNDYARQHQHPLLCTLEKA